MTILCPHAVKHNLTQLLPQNAYFFFFYHTISIKRSVSLLFNIHCTFFVIVNFYTCTNVTTFYRYFRATLALHVEMFSFFYNYRSIKIIKHKHIIMHKDVASNIKRLTIKRNVFIVLYVFVMLDDLW